VTPEPSSASRDPLAPLVSALLDRATRDADAVLARADAEADETLARARAQADEILAEARARGARDAEAVLAAERSRAEREARAVVLAAQSRVHESARRAVRAAVATLQDDPAYPDLLAVLRTRAEHDLGPDARITELPEGGIEAVAGGRRLEFSLAGLADDLMDEVGGVEELWAP